jgi:endoglucanase
VIHGLHEIYGRRIALGLAALAAMLPRAAGAEALQAGWDAFRARHIAADGRVVDDRNGGISHSEGQAYAMFLAARLGDRPTFDRVRGWTRRVLAVRPDALLAWRFRPWAGHGSVDDANNATDADLMHGWALVEAHRRWGDVELRDGARRVARDILRFLVRDVHGRHILLPAADGFTRASSIDVNPSYYVFAAFQALALVLPDPGWHQLRVEGERLLEEARFDRWGLPSDWVRMTPIGRSMFMRPLDGSGFGWDAVRVPLHLVRAGLRDHPAVDHVLGFWSHAGVLTPGGRVALQRAANPVPAGEGVRAIAHLVAAARYGRQATPPFAARSHPAASYYDAALSLLAQEATAWLTSGQQDAWLRS